jgi:hypothetical protein
MRRSDIVAAGELAGEALAAGGALVGDMHAGIAGRPFGILGPLAAPVRVVHDGVSQAVYGGVTAVLRRGSRRAAGLAAARAADDGPPAGARTATAFALATLNGLYGNHLSERGNALALEMQVRRHGGTVPPTADALGHA